MNLYRIGKTVHAKDLSGEGARLYGGRWNYIGIPCIYTSESRALCILEYSANVAAAVMPANLSITTITVPGDSVVIISESDLNLNWKDNPYPDEGRQLIKTMFDDKKYLVVGVPSAIIPQEMNFIINPLHPRMSEVAISKIESYPYDSRIKK